jgi:peptidoglycan/LPS O-acetylase OafA/YrhL
MVWPFHYREVDSPMWSLSHEMRISLIFPLLVLLVLKGRWWGSLAVGAVLSIVATAGDSILGSDRTAIGPTLGYVVCSCLASCWPSIGLSWSLSIGDCRW